MILTGSAIRRAVDHGEIVITPFNPGQLGPNSYDFRLGDRCVTYRDHLLDSAIENLTDTHSITSAGLLLAPNRIYLCNTEEIIGSTKYVPIIRGRSSLARLGVFVNITADLIDIGSVNQLTLQLHAITPTRVYPGMLVGQVTFWQPHGAVKLYAGKYGKMRSPAPSLLFMDFDPERVSDASTSSP